MDAAEKLEIDRVVREAVTEVVAPLDERLGRVEAVVLAQTSTNAKFAEQITQCAAAAAHAADIGLKAMRQAQDSRDETEKIVRSAMTIHNASIASAVKSSIDDALRERDEVLADIRAKLTTVAKALGHPTLRKVLIAAAVLGAMIGGAVAGYMGGRAAPAAPPHVAAPR